MSDIVTRAIERVRKCQAIVDKELSVFDATGLRFVFAELLLDEREEKARCTKSRRKVRHRRPRKRLI